MASKNKNMNAARRNKKDEFYTQLTDIEKEMRHYRPHFEGKTIYLNCDDPGWSNFFIHFASQFAFYKLKKLIATHYNPEGVAYKIELTKALNPTADGISEADIAPYLTELKEDGDFRSEEAIELLKESDIVITNPPFSLFREYIAQLIEYDKKFIVLGNVNAVIYKEVFPLVKENKIWLGVNSNKAMEFRLHPDYEKWNRVDEFGNKYGTVPSITWFTNLQHAKRNEKLILFRKYTPDAYPKYDNYDAINVNKVVDIPMDYEGEMGVPITFIAKYNPEQFEIIDLIDRYLLIQNELNAELAERAKADPKNRDSKHRMTSVNGKPTYPRILIKRRK